MARALEEGTEDRVGWGDASYKGQAGHLGCALTLWCSRTRSTRFWLKTCRRCRRREAVSWGAVLPASVGRVQA